MDLSALLLRSCNDAATDFPGTVAWLRPRVETQSASRLLPIIRRLVSARDFGNLTCIIYLLAQAHSADLAAVIGWYALDLACDDDGVIIALADVLAVQTRSRQAASALMQQRCSDGRSTAFLIKLADHYRTSGRAFLAEDVLRGFIRRGRRDLMLRLAEHWIEWRDWRSARDLLRELRPDEETAYTLYLLARSCVALLLEDEVVQATEALMALPDPGPRYAALLSSVWTWRIGDPTIARRSCPEGDFPTLMVRDAVALRAADLKPDRQALTGYWRNITSRDDLPNILGIGMQRTATTWLWHQLTKHPDVHLQTFKELVFFNDPFGSPNNMGRELRDADLGQAGDLYWQGPTRSLFHYRGLFGEKMPVRIDISPSYGELPPEAVKRVREILGPDVKILLSVRDPVERSWSNLKFDLKLTGEHPFDLSLEQRIALYRSVATLRRSDYASVLRTWRRFFTDIKILFFNDVVARPAEVLEEVTKFMGLSPFPIKDYHDLVNISFDTPMPREDRMFLFGLHQSTYDAAEAELGGPALEWRQRQAALLDDRRDYAQAGYAGRQISGALPALNTPSGRLGWLETTEIGAA